MPFGSDRAMVTVDPGVRASAADVAAGSPRAVATNLDILHVVPEGARAYVTCGDDEARAFKGRPPAALAGARALFVNRVEALGLTGAATVEQAAAALAELAESVVVSLGADGGIIATGGECSRRRRSASTRPSTRRARATCSPRPTSGPTCTVPSRSTACAGRRSTRASA